VWTPTQAILDSSHWTQFTTYVNQQHGYVQRLSIMPPVPCELKLLSPCSLSLKEPSALWQWSVDSVELFWDAVRTVPIAFAAEWC
jgi:hypothetical protein